MYLKCISTKFFKPNFENALFISTHFTLQWCARPHVRCVATCPREIIFYWNGKLWFLRVLVLTVLRVILSFYTNFQQFLSERIRFSVSHRDSLVFASLLVNKVIICIWNKVMKNVSCYVIILTTMNDGWGWRQHRDLTTTNSNNAATRHADKKTVSQNTARFFSRENFCPSTPLNDDTNDQVSGSQMCLNY